MLEAYTYDALLADVLANAPEGVDTRKGSIFYDAVSGICIQIAKLYTDIDQVFEYVFISTATGKFLDMRAAEYGMERLNATPAKYRLVYEGNAPPVGVRFFHNETGKYFTIGSDSGELLLVSEEPGTSCNDIPAGDLAVPVNTIDGLISSSFGAPFAYGSDEEQDEDLRNRIREKIAGPAENGNKQHYKTWCESVDGVGIARITPLWNGPNTVKGVLISPLGLPCDPATVAAVQAYIDPISKGLTAEVDGKIYAMGDGLGEGVANLGAHFTAVAAESVDISIEFTAVLASGRTVGEAKTEVTKALEGYFKDLVMNTSVAADIVVRITAVGAMIAGCDSVIDYSDLKLNGGAGNIFPGEDGVPVIEEVTVNVNV